MKLLLLASVWLECVAMLTAAAPPPDYRFKVEILAVGNMPQPMELEIAPDGRIFWNELSGKLKIWKPGGQIVEAGTVPVYNAQENGFLGFALDPKFTQNSFIYLFYSPTNYPGQRLSRFVMRGDALDNRSERVILEFSEQRRECCHHAGTVEFAPDGCLLISTGDNTHPGGDTAGYAPIDERPGQEPWDAQKSSANTHDLRGKILRLRLTPEGGYTIPDGNLFPKDGSAGRPEIYVMGCRNPWRMSVDSRTGIIYWGEVGPDAGGDGPRGSRGYDEINQARKAGNFGWPLFVGSNFTYAKYDFATKSVGPHFDPARPTNSSPNNTGAKVLPPAQPAFIYWPYGESKEFPMLGTGGRTACAGPVFHFKPEFKKTGGFPEHFDRCLLFWDWQRPFMKWARLDSDSRLAGIESFSAAIAVANAKNRITEAERAGTFVIRRPVDAQFGPDGCLYLLDYGETWGGNPDAKLIKISYQWGNLAPIARATVMPTAGREPLQVALSAAGSKDHEGDALKFEWRLHGPTSAATNAPGKASASSPAPVAKLVASTAEAKLTVPQPGNYIVELRVSDDQGASSKTTLPLIVGNTAPSVRFIAPVDGDFFTPGKPLAYKIAVTDAEDGTSTQNDELMDARVFMTAKFSKGDGKDAVDEPGLALMKQSDCFNCHAVETKVVGPAFLQVANKYRGQAGALDASVQRVIKGSSRVWGEVPMLPHEGLTTDQVQLMVRWVFGLEPGKAGSAMTRGLGGNVTPPTDTSLRFASLEATYTDLGRGPAGSLAGRSAVQLRSRRLEAEVSEVSGAKVSGNHIGSINHGHSVKFTSLNLADTASVTVRVASGGVGGNIEFRSGSATGELLATLKVENTGKWDAWKDVTTELKPPPGRGDVVAVFVNPGKSGLMNVDWFQFNAR
ncbi:MAG: carbohydrate-binding protein [Verrucomicrobia bacterium]|nr:carbohydrate-binding protein [Verrucomicrobiota bacterium]